MVTADELKKMHGSLVWCEIPSDNPCWGFVDSINGVVILGLHHHLNFEHYGEWKAYKTKVR